MLLWIIAFLLLVLILASETGRSILSFVLVSMVFVGICLYVLTAVGLTFLLAF